MTKLFVAGDPTWANGFSNIADAVMGGIKGEGDREVRQSGMALRGAQARFNNARAAGVEGQNAVRTMTALKAAGYSDAEAAAIIATGDNSVSSVFQGVNSNRGRTALENGNPAVALPLLGQATAFDDYVKGETQRKLMTNPDGSFNSGLAAAVAGGVNERGGNLVTLAPNGTPIIGALTGEGKARVDLFNTQGVNDTSRTTSQNSVDAARAGAITKTGDANVDLITTRGAAVTQGANDKTTLTGARVETEGARQSAIGQGADDKTRVADAFIDNRNNESSARVNRTNANTNNDALKATAAAASGVDPVKAANAQATLRSHINDVYSKDFSDRFGTNSWETVDPAQKKSITDRALRYVVQGGLDLGTAMQKSEADHGLTGKTVKGQKDKLFGLKKSPDGKITFDGFRQPVDSDSGAGAVLDALRAGTPAPAPVGPVASAAPAAAAAPALPPPAERPVGLTIEKDGRKYEWSGKGWKPL